MASRRRDRQKLGPQKEHGQARTRNKLVRTQPSTNPLAKRKMREENKKAKSPKCEFRPADHPQAQGKQKNLQKTHFSPNLKKKPPLEKDGGATRSKWVNPPHPAPPAERRRSASCGALHLRDTADAGSSPLRRVVSPKAFS